MSDPVNPEKVVKMNYPGNSHAAKAAPAKEESARVPLERVVKGEVVKRKQPLGRKIAETFTSEDAQGVGNYVVMEVIVPAFRDMVVDAGKQALERIFYGEGTRRRSAGVGGAGYTNYGKMYSGSSTGRPREEPRTMSQKARATHNFDEVILESRAEAEMILDTLSARIDQYDVASVSDMLDLLGITGSYTDEKWGWVNLVGSRVRPVREGYLLDLPKPVALD